MCHQSNINIYSLLATSSLRVYTILATSSLRIYTTLASSRHFSAAQSHPQVNMIQYINTSESCWTLSNVRCCWVTLVMFILCEYSIEVDIPVFLCVLYRVRARRVIITYDHEPQYYTHIINVTRVTQQQRTFDNVQQDCSRRILHRTFCRALKY
jgi:hypothetical protein